MQQADEADTTSGRGASAGKCETDTAPRAFVIVDPLNLLAEAEERAVLVDGMLQIVRELVDDAREITDVDHMRGRLGLVAQQLRAIDIVHAGAMRRVEAADEGLTERGVDAFLRRAA